MAELIVHHAFNPNSGRRRMLVREVGWKPHKLRLSGPNSLPFEMAEDGNISLAIPAGTVVGTGTQKAPIKECYQEPKNLALKPGGQVTLRFKNGKIIHTVGHLPPDNDQHAAAQALRRAKVYTL